MGREYLYNKVILFDSSTKSIKTVLVCSVSLQKSLNTVFDQEC